MTIGCDIDGVLAKFETRYAELLTRETGLQFPIDGPGEPAVWFWERAAFKAAGWTEADAKAVEKKVWKEIMAEGSTFWLSLDPLPEAMETLETLHQMRANGDDIYFITSRPGAKAKLQTEGWLTFFGFPMATVLIASEKGPLATSLKLDVFIDDKPENCTEVMEATKKTWPFSSNRAGYSYPCQVFLVDRPYNQELQHPGIVRVSSALDALRRAQESNGFSAAA